MAVASSAPGAARSREGMHASAAERALAILELLRDSGRGRSISAVGRELHIPKSSAHVLLRTLEDMGYVQRTGRPRGYALGPRAAGLSTACANRLLLPELAHLRMQWLADQTGLAAHLAVMNLNQVEYLHKAESPTSAKFDSYPGKRANLHCTAVGKVLLAFASEHVAQAYFARDTFAHHTEKTITTARALRREIVKVKRQGYAVDDEEEEIGVRCLAIPVFSPSGEVAAALGITGTVEQLQPEAVGPVVSLMKRAAAGILVRSGDDAAAPQRG